MNFQEALTKWNDDEFRGAPARLARLLKVSPATVSGWVNGVKPPGEKTMKRIAKAMGIPVEEVKRMLSFGHSVSLFREGVKAFVRKTVEEQTAENRTPYVPTDPRVDELVLQCRRLEKVVETLVVEVAALKARPPSRRRTGAGAV